jgi:hypothetical protein
MGAREDVVVLIRDGFSQAETFRHNVNWHGFTPEQFRCQ